MSKVREIMARRAAGEKGFTLVELLVVVVILVVLAAIAVPIFLNQANKAKSAKAQNNVAAVANVVKNGQGVGDTVTKAGTVVSYTGSTGTQSIDLAGAALDTTTIAPNGTWCVSQTDGGDTWHMDETTSAPATGAC